MSTAATLHEPPVGGHLVGSVDREVEMIELVESTDVEPELPRGQLGPRRGRHVDAVE